jgi:ABC-type transport system substrate-binding protein
MRFHSNGATPYSSRKRQSSFGERAILTLAVILLIGGPIGYLIDVKSRKREVPDYAGIYTEGVIADSPTKVDRIIARLTNIGLTYRDSDSIIKPALAEAWEISPDGKTYLFHLRDGYSASGVLSIIQNSKTAWTDVAITAPSESRLQFVLSEPHNMFLSTTSVPLFPYGSYQVAKREKSEVILKANERFVLGKPYVQKISIKLYDTPDKLLAAAQEKEINGSADFVQIEKDKQKEIPRLFKEQILDLPRYYVLFFNVARPAFKKIEDRQRVITAADGAPVAYTLFTSQTGTASDLADSLAKELEARHITLTIQKKAGATLQKEDIAKREFDLLLYGINYGVSRDYYPFWHSSQATATGLNISGIKDKELDTLLEQTRRETDEGKRTLMNQQIETFLHDKALQKIISQEKTRFWIDSSIRGVKYGTIEESNDRFSLVWQWYIKSKKVR